MPLRYVSVHLAKTGGRTVEAILSEHFGEEFKRIDIGTPLLASVSRPEFRRKLRDRTRSLAIRAGLFRPRCIHGHFRASTFLRDGDFLLTFLRDPAERAVSDWRFHNRLFADPTAERNARRDTVGRRALEEHLCTPEPNVQIRLDVPVERFDFVGHQPTLDADIAWLGEIIGFSAAPLRVNAAPTPTEVTQEQRALYEAANPGEVEIYHRMLERRAALIRARDRAGR